MGIIKLGRKVRQARNFVKSGSDFVAPHVDQLQEQVNLWAPRVTDAATQVKQLIVEEAPVKAGIAKEKAASIVENSKTLEGAREDALLLKEQLAARAAEVANEASTRVSEAAALTADHVDQASKVAAETSEKASKHASKRAHKRADKVAKRAAKAAAKADRHAGKAQKPHRGLKFFLVVGPLLAIGAAVAVIYRRSQPIEDPWAEEYWEDVDFRGTSSDDLKEHAAETVSDVVDKANEAAAKVADKLGK